MTLPSEFSEKRKPSVFELKADELISGWKEHLPDEPWDVIKRVMLLVAEKHPDIILLTNDRTRMLLDENQIILPRGKSVMDIAGRVNPGLAILRNLRKP